MSHNDISEKVRNILADIKDPESGVSIAKRKQIVEVTADEQQIGVKIGLTSFSFPIRQDFENSVRQALSAHVPDHVIELEIVEHQRSPEPLGTVGLKVRAVLAVGSGKGGVGKSTVALSLAIALRNAGCKVGLLDADVYGPSIPHLTGVRGNVYQKEEKLTPLDFDGMPIISVGYMMPSEEAIIWRGPVLDSAVTSLVRDVAWGELDFLIVDMPPGTGDVALSLSQSVPVSGAVVVCTPQEIALIDAIKAVSMFRQLNIPVLGMIENMSSFICPDTGKRHDIFGTGGARAYAERDSLTFLGEIPINIQLRERGDAGQMKDNFDDPDVRPYLENIAYQVVKSLAENRVANPPKPQLPVLS